MGLIRAAPQRLAAALGVALVVLVTAGCSQPATKAPGPVKTTTSTAAQRMSTGKGPGCSDDQPGRYTAELFQPAPVSTVTYTPGLQADIYAPADDPATCKVGVVWVHGGGFTLYTRNGDAEREWGFALARRGFVVASIDYRLGSGEPFALDSATGPQREMVVENAITDAQTAVGWLRGAAGDWGVDPTRVAIGGTSAGAMTALGAALTAADPPCAVVSVAGDLRPEWVTGPGAAVLFIHGNADDVLPFSSSVAGVAAVQAAGGTAELVTIDRAGHEITGPPRPAMVDAAARWLADHAAAGCG
jgi:acetyl esterase/lipase